MASLIGRLLKFESYFSARLRKSPVNHADEGHSAIVISGIRAFDSHDRQILTETKLASYKCPILACLREALITLLWSKDAKRIHFG